MNPPSTDPTQDTATSLTRAAFERHHEALKRFLLRRLPRTEDARDLLQEVYVRLLSIERGTLVRNPRAYIYGVAAHVAREVRARTLRERVSFDSEAVDHVSENPPQVDADSLAEGLNLERQVDAALSKLSPNHLKVLIADRRDGLSQDDIARQLGLSTHTVKKYLVQALTQVRESWQFKE